ncbi:NAD(P)H-binding protein [Candidatus Woesearchaeota archaeon]|nr:MAG: NAD(P)H-binding protein [Candidatus Woesearchaeota archaeon]
MRYSRQIIYEKIGKEKQKLLESSKVVVVGCGALGSIASELLVRAGVGHIIIIDRDILEEHNLQRQTLFTEGDIGHAKAYAAAQHLKKINSHVIIDYHIDDLSHKNTDLLKSNLVLDCTDNMHTRFLINEYCRKNKIPWIYTAVIESRGMMMSITPKRKHCFRCVFDEPSHVETCETAGILNTTPHALVAMQVTEAFKILTKQLSEKDLVNFDLWNLKLSKVKVKSNPQCPVCNGVYEYLDGKKESLVRLCGSGNYQFKGKVAYYSLKNNLSKIGKVKDLGYCFHFKELTVFKDRVLIKSDSEAKARSLYSKYIGN